MNRKLRSGQEAASILQALFNATDDLSCEQAQHQLPSLVDNERAGIDVDQQPAYAALLQHLDHCADCTDLYAAISENLAALTDTQLELPTPTTTPPTIFPSGRRSDQVLVRVIAGLKRRFALDLSVPSLKPTLATLGHGQQLALFSAKLPELTNNPFVSVALKLGTDQPELAVAIRESSRSRWHIQLQINAQVYSAATDEHGIAQIRGFTREQLQTADQLSVTCAELLA